jgi:hypothetical protein
MDFRGNVFANVQTGPRLDVCRKSPTLISKSKDLPSKDHRQKARLASEAGGTSAFSNRQEGQGRHLD